MQNTFLCPHCNKEIELSEALVHRFKEEANLQSKEENEKRIKEAQEKIRKELEEKERKKDQEFKEKELLLEANARKLEEERKKNIELEESFEKRRKEDQEKIREETSKEEAEKHRLEKLEWEKQKADMQKAIEEAHRKGKQGSQQLQGEVLELDFEEQLKQQFPHDEFLPIPKGVEGGDIWQKIRDEHGTEIGSIIWETKRTKAFAKSFLPKLRSDMRGINANEAILVTQTLPNDVKSFNRIENVWVTNYEYAIQVARMVRFLIMKVTATKLAATSHEDAELQKIRDFIISDSFRHKIEMHNDAVKQLREDHYSEMRTTQTRWRKREQQINALDTSVNQLYGDLQGIMGDSLPDLKSSNLLEEGEK